MPSPEILHLGCFSLRWYGVFAALAACVCYALLLLRRRRYGFDADKIADLLLCCVVFGVLGARLEYVRRMWAEEFSGDPLAAFRIWEGGLVFQGGFILAAIAALVLCRIRKWPIGTVGDLMAVALPCGHAVARVGCFLNGCCFGRALSPGSPWGVCYPPEGNQVLLVQQWHHLLPAGATSPLPVLPVQLLESAQCLLVAGFIFILERRKCLEGLRFFIYIILYCLMRVTTEFWRGDYADFSLPTPAQKTTLFLILPVTILVLLGCLLYRRRAASSSPDNGHELP